MLNKFEVDVDSRLRPNNILRRYLDLPKFVDMLRTQCLYFRRTDKFSDRFEGALTPSIRSLLNEPIVGAGENADAYYQRARHGAYASCWSLGAKDNMALWQLYGGVTSSVAITTTIKQLSNVAQTWPDITSIAKIDYIDHFKNPSMIVGNYTDVLEFKHIAYTYENEVRVIISRHRGDWEKNPVDLRLPIPNISNFIRSIVVAPEAEDWFFDMVQEIASKFDVVSPVRRSELTRLPE